MDDGPGAQLKKVRDELEGIRLAKHKTFTQLHGLAERAFRQFPEVFPMYDLIKNGSRFVHHPNVPECPPISLEKEHGCREYLPHRYAKFGIEGIEKVLDYIESQINENT